MKKTQRWFPEPKQTRRLEFLDEPERFVTELPDNLRDIRTLNRWFGGVGPVLSHIAKLADHRHGELLMLDVATGSADIPVALCKWARRRQIEVRVVGLDVSERVLSEARLHIMGQPVDLILGSAQELPFADRSFDIVTCNLALHHFDARDAEEALREMWRVTRDSVVITDVRRSYAGYIGAWLLTRLTARNRVTRHDAPLSVLRAYTVKEVCCLAIKSGIAPFRAQKQLFFRQSLVGRKPRAAPTAATSS